MTGLASLRGLCPYLALLMVSPAWAGPPFVTDDPVPVEHGHWEIYGFSSAIRARDGAGGTLFGLDMNYGAAANLHLHMLAALAFDAPVGGSSGVGVGDLEVGAKWRIVEAAAKDWWPHIAVYPLIAFPTGDMRRGLGAGHTRAFLPLWLQKDIGAWTTYGGIGYGLNRGFGNRDYWFFGWQVQRQLTERFAVGIEGVHLTADTVDGPAATGFNLGGMYDLSASYHLLASAGRGVQNIAATDQFQYYVGIQWTK
jgi:hypothetical protein